MKKVLILLLALIITVQASSAWSYWIWTPETKRWINPEHEVKGSPDEQLEWIKKLYETKDYDRALKESWKLLRTYPRAKEAPEAQFYIAQCQEGLGRYYDAFKSYQKVLDDYPQSERVKEVIEKEYQIGNLFFSGKEMKIMGITFSSAIERAVEIFQKVLSNEPFGKYSDLSQFKLGLCYAKQSKYVEAKVEFDKLIEQYPKSSIVDDANFQSALCSYHASLKPEYDSEATDEAIKRFKELLASHPDIDVETKKETQDMILDLEEKSAEKLLQTAKFYETQRKPDSAVIYYLEILNKYPHSRSAALVVARLRELGKLPPEWEREEGK